MRQSKTPLKRYAPFFLVSFLVLLAAEVAHYVFWGQFFVCLINTLILSLYVAYWPCSGLSSPQNRAFKKYRLAMAAVMLFWFFCKCAKDRFLMETPALMRLSWYAYYVAIILLPLLCYEFSLRFDQSSAANYRTRVGIFRGLALLLIAAILTNDLHQLAFSFPNGISAWAEDSSRGPLYFAAAAYGLVLFIAALVHIFQQCTLPNSKKYIWLPITPLAVGVAYVVLYFFDRDLFIHGIRIFALSDVFCCLIMIFIDACEVVYQIATELPGEEALLLHRIWGEIEPRMDRAEKNLNKAETQREETYKAELFYAGFYQTYSKRMANLILLGEQNGTLEFAELTLSLAESVEFLKLSGIGAMLVSEGERLFPASELLSVYRAFEERLEPVLPTLGAVLVFVSAESNGIQLRISAEDREGNEL